LLEAGLKKAIQRSTKLPNDRLNNARMRLELLNPALVLKRGYAWLATLEGQAVTSATQTQKGQALRATLMDGEVDLTVSSPRLI
jgi:exodeoxyribonuclease VII large subunit